MRRNLSFLLLIVLLAAGCAPTPSVDLEPAQVSQRVGQEGVIIVDVRQPDEWQNEGHIEGAVLMSLDQLASEAKDYLDPEMDIILVCHSGALSKVALELLRNQGFTHLFELKGGMIAWMMAGQPVVYGR